MGPLKRRQLQRKICMAKSRAVTNDGISCFVVMVEAERSYFSGQCEFVCVTTACCLLVWYVSCEVFVCLACFERVYTTFCRWMDDGHALKYQYVDNRLPTRDCTHVILQIGSDEHMCMLDLV